jgi:cephalosporin-C deacetylase-like acetyl esterase
MDGRDPLARPENDPVTRGARACPIRPIAMLLAIAVVSASACGSADRSPTPAVEPSPVGRSAPTESVSPSTVHGGVDPAAGASPRTDTSHSPVVTPRPAATTVPPAAAPTAPVADPVIFAYDRSRPLRARESELDATPGARHEHVIYEGADGERVPAILSLPARGKAPFACIVVGHGFRGDKTSLPVGDLLARAGFASFAIDARAHGERRDEETLRRVETDPAALERMLRETVIDMRRGVDYLSTRAGCDPARIGYLGASMGGFLGAMLAGVDERVQAPVLLVSGGDWSTMLESSVAREFRRRATSAGIERARRLLDPIDPVRWVGRISPRPVLMIAGDADTAVPPASARALHAAAREPKTVVWYHGGHTMPAADEGQRILTTVALWLAGHLGP